jgi:hypothetical protein
MAKHASHKLNATQHAADLPPALQHTRFRSQLEIRFALALEARRLRWFYEPERIARYLIDFYLPDSRSWVEVKGVVSTRDHRLLREAAVLLAAARKHRLYMWTEKGAYLVTAGDFAPLPLADFWAILTPPPAAPPSLDVPPHTESG